MVSQRKSYRVVWYLDDVCALFNDNIHDLSIWMISVQLISISKIIVQGYLFLNDLTLTVKHYTIIELRELRALTTLTQL